MNARRFGAAIAIVALTVSVGALGAFAGTGNSEVVGVGPDLVSTLVSPNPLAGASVEVSAGELGSGNVQITLDVGDVAAPAGTTFGAHVHVSPCGADPSVASLGAGAHYQDTGTQGPLARSEVWLDFTVDAHGRGHAVATRQFTITPPLARSVIIHAMETDHDTGVAGGRLACTNVTF